MKLSKIILVFILFLQFGCSSNASKDFVNPNSTTYSAEINRDEWGVAHIYAKTDADAAYGLKYAHCEDNFKMIQEAFIIMSEKPYGKLYGDLHETRNAQYSLVAQLLLKNKDFSNWDEGFSPEYIEILKAGTSAINDYAINHPEEIINGAIFPVKEVDVVKGYLFGLAYLTMATMDYADLFLSGTDKDIDPFKFRATDTHGSNAWAYAPSKTIENETVVIANPHMPTKGVLSFYEAHVRTDEGTNMHGATFSVSPTLLIGTTPNLSWSNTVESLDYADVFELEMHPTDELKYKYDEEWLELKELDKVKIGIKGFLKLKLPVKLYESVYGLTIKTKNDQYLSIKSPIESNYKTLEGVWKLSKTKNLAEFKEVLATYPTQVNFIVGDKAGNIFFTPNGTFPKRDVAYDWTNVVPGNTSKTNWDGKEYHPFNELPQIENPNCGYVFSCNQSPFFASTSDEDQLIKADYDYLKLGNAPHNSRSKSFKKLIEAFGQDKLSFAAIENIKYNSSYAIKNDVLPGFGIVQEIDADSYPEIVAEIKNLQAWDGTNDKDSNKGTLANLVITHILTKKLETLSLFQYKNLTEDEIIEAVTASKKILDKYHDGLDTKLGSVQRLWLDDEHNLPISGSWDVLTAQIPSLYEDKYIIGQISESFIQFTRFKADSTVVIETAMPYGASMKPESEFYGSQMEMYVNQKRKTMSLDINDLNIIDTYEVGSK